LISPNANCKPLLSFALVAACFAAAANAVPITFNTALPVSKGEVLFRQQFIVTRAGDNLLGVSRNLTTLQGVSVVGYGPARRTAPRPIAVAVRETSACVIRLVSSAGVTPPCRLPMLVS